MAAWSAAGAAAGATGVHQLPEAHYCFLCWAEGSAVPEPGCPKGPLLCLLILD
eukprot:CAMPEP_0194729244 /NCGR_PEP_ID=MMETSP0296-20130528/45731_1 /TAXON_ID=39354 /ORGANISM="Heterosigma akashiwo, Strain CCMP2393" /LENGTH=52 /DNA_ID=CAMNT_0039635639 /DNA_START=201 /DNA_END=356 /DNA_ORIENTATION=-